MELLTIINCYLHVLMIKWHQQKKQKEPVSAVWEFYKEPDSVEKNGKATKVVPCKLCDQQNLLFLINWNSNE